MNNSDELRGKALGQLGAISAVSAFSVVSVGDYIGHLEARRDGLQREVAELREALMAFHAIVGKWRDDGDYPDLDGLSAAVDRADKLLKSQSAQGGV